MHRIKMEEKKNFNTDDLFSEETILNLPELVLGESIDDIAGFSDDFWGIHYHLGNNQEDTRICFSYESKYVPDILNLLRKGFIAVYLDFITEAEEGDKENVGSSYSFDLVTPGGYGMYMRYIHNTRGYQDTNNRIATYIQFKNLRTKLNVSEKQYYLLDLKSLDKAELSGEENALYISVYDYRDIQGDSSVLPQLRPLPGLKGIVYNGKPLPNLHIPEFPKGILRLKVNNVGQGNRNELQTRKKTRLVYDLGTNIEKKSRDADNDKLINSHPYTRKPSLIISHWDLDHYNIFLYMNRKEKNQFSQLIVSTTLPSLTPFMLLQDVVQNTKIELSLVDIKPHLLTAPVNYINVQNKQLKLFACPMKMDGNKFNTNEFCLILNANAEDKNILMTGDCTYAQASEAVRLSFANIHQDKKHYLVVPHHGGGHTPNYQTPQHCNIKAAVLSVDELKKNINGMVIRHRYGHPTIETVCHFIKKHGCKLLRTDYANEDIIIS